jgi:hypothetical protein
MNVDAFDVPTIDIQRVRAIEAVLGNVDVQISTILALAAGGASVDRIVDEVRESTVTKETIINLNTATWSTEIAQAAFVAGIDLLRRGRVFKKQAIAAIDMRTTQTCLNVHGQIRNFNRDFNLRGEPKFAKKLPNPPFHFWCRTAMALYQKEFDVGLTDSMEAARAAMRKARDESSARNIDSALTLTEGFFEELVLIAGQEEMLAKLKRDLEEITSTF